MHHCMQHGVSWRLALSPASTVFYGLLVDESLSSVVRLAGRRLRTGVRVLGGRARCVDTLPLCKSVLFLYVLKIIILFNLSDLAL